MALQLKVDDPQIHNDLGVTLMQAENRLADAINQFQAALQIKPGDAQFRTNPGNALTQIPARRPAGAIADFAQARADLEAARALDPELGKRP